MCLEAASSNGQAVRFKSCANGVPQNFLYNDSQNLEGLTGTGPSGTCFNVSSPGVPGSTLVMWKVTGGKGGGQTSSGGCGSPATTTRTFLPDPLVGLGGTLPSGQLSSFALSNLCVSDDNGTVDMKTCQYVMGSTLITWDMLWTLPDPGLDGTITATNTNNKKQCLVSPGTATATSYVTVTQCPNTIPASMIWHRSTNTGLYATSYRIESRYGVASTSPSLCMAPVDPNATPPDPYLASGVTRLVMVTCSGSNLQKWNAPAAVLVDTLYDVTET